MKWLRLVGSLKTKVSFAQEPYKTDVYSAKETYIFKEPTNHGHPVHTANPSAQVERLAMHYIDGDYTNVAQLLYSGYTHWQVYMYIYVIHIYT